VPGISRPSLIAVPSRSTVSSNVVCDWTGANTASSEPVISAPGAVPITSPHSRSKPRIRSQSVTAASNADTSTSVACT
jgi:hypothetical protein